MKKLALSILILLLAFFAFSMGTTYAATFTPEPGASEGGLWHVEDGNQAYAYMRYTIGAQVQETGVDQEHYSTWWGGKEDDFSFNSTTPKASILTNPDPLVYTKFRVQIIANINVIVGPDPVVIDILNTEDVDAIEVRITDWADRPNTNYLYDYSFFDLYVDGIKSLTSRNISEDVTAALGYPTNPNYTDITFGVKMYWSKTDEVILDPDDPLDPLDPWGELPVTTGNPASPLGVWGEVDTWNYDASTHKFSFTINYLETLYQISNVTVSGDTDFLAKTKKIAYYTDPQSGDRILYMNFSDEVDSMILKTGSISSVNIWEGEALWNLSENEVSVTNVLRVFNYIPEIESTGQVYSYFYMPDVPVDDLLSVTVNLGYRYHTKDWPWSSYEPGVLQSKTITLTKGATSLVNPTWVEDVYRTSFWVGGITTAMMVLATPIGIVPVYGWGIAAASFIVGGLFLAADHYEFFAYDVAQIQHVIPDADLRNNIDLFIQSKDPTADPIDTINNKLYKLNLGVLDDGEYPQVMEEYSSVTQIVWQTDGKIYTATGDYIYDEWGGPGTENPDATFLDQYGIILIILGGIISAGVILPILDKGLGSISSISKNPRKLIILGVIIFVLLYLLGYIKI